MVVFIHWLTAKGNVKDSEGKTAYGNAFGLYASAAWYQASGDNNALQLAKDCFAWLEKNAHDPILKGYYQNLLPDGTPVKRTAADPSHQRLVIKIRIVLFICWKHLQNYIPYGPMH
jgi:mannobiose 2-epimerase